MVVVSGRQAPSFSLLAMLTNSHLKPIFLLVLGQYLPKLYGCLVDLTPIQVVQLLFWVNVYPAAPMLSAACRCNLHCTVASGRCQSRLYVSMGINICPNSMPAVVGQYLFKFSALRVYPLQAHDSWDGSLSIQTQYMLEWRHVYPNVIFVTVGQGSSKFAFA